ncbi:tryptophan 2,3-dioxygenase family protein [Nocardia sp. NPDC004068]|uniref:tryptophan 2,3-dioxygenase family protein n=1 Tax=Nocardia sp. NPDC004068 TaxID=3364303 RepID=UPI0036A19E94
MDLAEAFARWRQLHLLTVERLIGGKPGTGGTSGVAWLRRVAAEHIFPELWSARSDLAGGPTQGCPFADPDRPGRDELHPAGDAHAFR